MKAVLLLLSSQRCLRSSFGDTKAEDAECPLVYNLQFNILIIVSALSPSCALH